MEERVNYFIKNPIVLDGFLFTGKDEFCEQILPDHTPFTFLDQSIMTFILATKPKKKIVFSGNLITDAVIDKVLYNKPISLDVSFYQNTEYYRFGMEYIYLKHSDEETARKYYNEAVMHGFDAIKSFDNYWFLYINAHEFYKSIYKRIGVIPRVFERNSEGKFKETSRLYG